MIYQLSPAKALLNIEGVNHALIVSDEDIPCSYCSLYELCIADGDDAPLLCWALDSSKPLDVRFAQITDADFVEYVRAVRANNDSV